MAERKTREERLRAYQRTHRQLAAQIAKLGYLWSGSITRQRLTCGKPTCACHRDPARRHGPYVYWSTKVNGRTVNRLLSAEQAELYQEWIENRRKLRTLEREMLKLSKRVAPLLLRQRRKPKRSH